VGYTTKEQVKADLDIARQEVTQQEEKLDRLKKAETAIVNLQNDWVTPARTNISAWKNSINSFGDFSWEGTGVITTKGLAEEAEGLFCYGYYSYCTIYARRLNAVTTKISTVSSTLKGLRAERDNLQSIYNSWDANHPD
jgi:hypothetical protein